MVTPGPALAGFEPLRQLRSEDHLEVLLYRQQDSATEVTVELLAADVSLSTAERSGLLAEAEAAVALPPHPHLVPVLAAGTTEPDDGRRIYQVSEHCPDDPVVAGTVVRSPAEALRTGIALAGALATAHRAGVVHRHLSPAQVLTRPGGTPALTGFGLPSLLTTHLDDPWAAPELLDGRSEGSVAGDVYSLGATIWGLLAGRSPFAGADDSPGARSARILHSAPPASTGRSDVPQALEELLVRCLAKSPDQRPSSAGELGRALQRIEAAEGLEPTEVAGLEEPADEATGVPVAGGAMPSVPDAARPAAAPEVAQPGVARSPALWWVVAAVVLVAIGGFVVWRAATAGSRSFAPNVAPSSAPGSAEPGVVPRPTVTAHRSGGSVFFRWHASDSPQGGDTYVWRVAGRGEQPHLTNGTTTTVRSAAKVCLRVRLTRAGRPPSPWATACA
ncbi:MAG: protein kinase [Nocardioides sp.]